MSKRKTNELTPPEIYYIQQNPGNLSLDDLAFELNKDIEEVRRHYNPRQHKIDCVHRAGFTAMSPQLSQLIDEKRTSNAHVKSSKLNGCIKKIYPDRKNNI